MLDLPIKTFDELKQEPKHPYVGNVKVSYNEAQIISYALGPLYDKLKEEQYVGNGTVELLNCTMNLDPLEPVLNFNDGIKKTNVNYVKKELDWYLSEDLSIIGHVDDVKIWTQCCTKDEKKEINSNYGYLVFSKENGSQFENCVKVLTEDKLTRNGLIMYNRPSIYTDYVRDGMHDMICTVFSQFFIRDNKLEMIHVMRSNDIIYGFLNDWSWNCFVYQNMYESLKKFYPELEYGMIHWTSTSMHCYERHYDTLRKIVESYDNPFKSV